MLRKCYHSIKECTDLQGNSVGNPDFPLLNLSSETPEVREYVYYPGPTPIGGQDDPTGLWNVMGCKSLCTSTISLEDAMLCAARQALECANDKNQPKPNWSVNDDDPISGGDSGGPGGNGGDPNPATPGGSDDGTPDGGSDDPGDDDETEDPNGGGPEKTIYKNQPTECTVYCEGDGSAFTKTIAAGMFTGLTQAYADEQAYKYACQRARLEKICLPELPTRYKTLCLYEEISFKMTVGGINPPYTIEVSGLPGGLTPETNETGTAVTIAGIPGSSSDGFTIKVTDKFGNTVSKDYVWEISGVSPAPMELPPCYNLCPYSFTFQAVGVVEGTTEWLVINLPPGLEMHNGTIEGNATSPGAYYIRVCWWDSGGHSCCADYTLNVYDCSNVPQQSFMLGLSNQSQVARLSSELMPCDRTVYAQCLGFRAGLVGPAYAFLYVNIYDWDDSLMTSWKCGWVSPFAAELDQSLVFPATLCNQTGSRRIEIEYIFGCFSPKADDCGMGCTLQIWGY